MEARQADAAGFSLLLRRDFQQDRLISPRMTAGPFALHLEM